MEIITALTVMCFVPFGILVFGYWLGRGAPGWPWALVRREAEGQPASRNVYYGEEH